MTEMTMPSLPEIDDLPDATIVEITEDHHDQMRVLTAQAEEARRSDQFGKAVEAAQAALKLHPAHAPALMVIQEILLEIEQSAASAGVSMAEALFFLEQVRQLPDSQNAEAMEMLDTLVRHLPGDACLHMEMAKRANSVCDWPKALQACAFAAALAPEEPDVWIAWAGVLGRCNQTRLAILALRQAVAVDPTNVRSQVHLAEGLIKVGLRREAVLLAGNLTKSHPELSEPVSLIARILTDAGRAEEAVEWCRCAVALRPTAPYAHMDLGLALARAGHSAAAHESFRTAGDFDPPLHDCVNVALSLVRAGLQNEAREFLESLVARGIGGERLHSLLIWLIEHIETISLADQQGERRRWDEMHAGPKRFPPRPHLNSRDPERRLRVGLVSGEFHNCSAVFGYSALMTDRSPDTEIYLYSNTTVFDPTTTWLRSLADGWRDIVYLDDDAAAELVRKDGIDILIDISGHSWRQHRLMMFARKPAPIQITAWGFASGVGLSAVDYLLSDEILIPREQAPLFNEEIFYLPSVIGYRCPDEAPPITPLPAKTSGTVTFGSFSSVEKLSDPLLDMWSEILHRVPGSRLVLKYHGISSSDVRSALIRRFSERGIPETRLELIGGTSWIEHMEAYGQLDIALDTWPHSGGITTMDALWMGIPVITLCGERRGGRNGASLLTSVGMPEWITHTPEDYVAMAIERAGKLDELAAVRASLRDKVRNSVVAPPNYARAVEAGFRQMWRRWCAEQK